VNAAELVRPGEDDTIAALAFWSLAHGLSTLIIDGSIQPELVRSKEAIEALTRAVLAQWRS
jgi:hypothetical protein